jgi:simple sugar transport system permease protein
VPSFITTLGMAFMLQGIAETWTNGFPQQTPGGHTFASIMGGGNWSEFIWAACIVVAMQVLLSFTPWGLRTVATGGNILGAREIGVRVNRIKIGNFMLVGVLAALTGVLESVRITSVDASAGGTQLMFQAVVAAVIGGTSLMGGSGTIAGAFVGALVVAVLNDGMNLMGVNAFTSFIVLGAAILAAMIVNMQLQTLRTRGR